ncbi:RsmE family RNA methyltransferase [uncultured Desulfobacter sp.]|uniref:RsmE family RNA methyltransferase n=1 Tax=uncultured Desulfobacter sp. TaxID=240139 RepID=UPI002AAADE96|nr:RsmE family RNA methyltransferase [uncultured Desulfobacter sp.]
MQKFLIGKEALTADKVVIHGQDAKHICKVLRLKPKDAVSMTDGHGTDFTGCIEKISPDLVEISIVSEKKSLTESPLDLTLCTAMLKHNKMDEIIKQITQLGVTRWIPFYCKRSIPLSDKKKEGKQIERWQTIARESLKQCRRSCLVEIMPAMDFEQVLAFSKECSHKIAFWEASDRPLAPPDTQGSHSAVVLIGPEGGFEEEEIRLAVESGFVSYSLGPRILRAETAAVCACGLVQYLLGDMGGC